MRHGTAGAYAWDKCRCDDCREAAAEARRQHRRRSGAVPWEAQKSRQLYEATSIQAEWVERAACRGQSPAAFFAEKRSGRGGDSNQYREARQVCARCPVRVECLEYAMSAPEHDGFWGGKSPKERRALRRNAA